MRCVTPCQDPARPGRTGSSSSALPSLGRACCAPSPTPAGNLRCSNIPVPWTKLAAGCTSSALSATTGATPRSATGEKPCGPSSRQRPGPLAQAPARHAEPLPPGQEHAIRWQLSCHHRCGPSHRFVTGFLTNLSFSSATECERYPDLADRDHRTGTPAVTEVQRWRATALRVSAPIADSARSILPVRWVNDEYRFAGSGWRCGLGDGRLAALTQRPLAALAERLQGCLVQHLPG